MTPLRAVRDGENGGPTGPPLKVLFCGSRDWDDRRIIETVMEGLRTTGLHLNRPLVVIEGEARGADSLSRAAAQILGVEVIGFPADWDQFGKGAGPIRNQQMLDQGPDLVMAFSDDIETSRGTRDMCTRAKKAGIPVYVVSRF